ncbi:MAG: hypothetical protein ACRCZI_12210 [Cetobacterium sp.]
MAVTSSVDMRPARCDLSNAVRGDTLTLTLTFRVQATQAPIDLTGRTFAAQVRDREGSSTLIASFSIDTTNAATGVLVLSIPAATTATWAWTHAVWDLQQTVGSVVQTLVAGRVTPGGQVTQ